MKSKNGFSVVALLVAAGIVVLAGAGYYWWDATSGQRVACTEEAKVCPDGSTVGRTGPKCEFAACPETAGITGAECRARGGEVVNTLTGTPSYQPSEVVGEIREANCPCVCVKRSVVSTTPFDVDDHTVIAEFEKQWPELQKQISVKPVLGATSWHITAFQMFGNRMLVAFEDGHIGGAILVSITKILTVTLPMPGVIAHPPVTESKNITFTIDETIAPDHFPLPPMEWGTIIVRYGGTPSAVRTYMTSVVRGTRVITFNGWVNVPENPFVRMAPAKAL